MNHHPIKIKKFTKIQRDFILWLNDRLLTGEITDENLRIHLKPTQNIEIFKKRIKYDIDTNSYLNTYSDDYNNLRDAYEKVYKSTTTQIPLIK